MQLPLCTAPVVLPAPIPLVPVPPIGYLCYSRTEPEVLLRVSRIDRQGWIETEPVDPDDERGYPGTIHPEEWSDWMIAYEPMRSRDEIRTSWIGVAPMFFETEAQYNERIDEAFGFSTGPQSMADPEPTSHHEYDAEVWDIPLSPLDAYYLIALTRLNDSNRAGLAYWVAEFQDDLLKEEHQDKLNVIARLIELARYRYQTGQILKESNVCSRCGGLKGMFQCFNPNHGRCFRCNDTGIDRKIQLA